MRRLQGINISSSLKANKLVFDVPWTDVLDSIAFYLFFSSPIVFIGILVNNTDFNNSNDAFLVAIILPLIALLCGYVMYRKATERKLTKITSRFDEAENHQLLLEYAASHSLEVYSNASCLLICNEPLGGWNDNYKRSYIFILSSHNVYVSALKDTAKLNLPVIISYIFLKRDLRKLLGVS
ncbi:hypothetical protein [Hymenobacter terrigena]